MNGYREGQIREPVSGLGNHEKERKIGINGWIQEGTDRKIGKGDEKKYRKVEYSALCKVRWFGLVFSTISLVTNFANKLVINVDIITNL